MPLRNRRLPNTALEIHRQKLFHYVLQVEFLGLEQLCQLSNLSKCVPSNLLHIWVSITLIIQPELFCLQISSSLAIKHVFILKIVNRTINVQYNICNKMSIIYQLGFCFAINFVELFCYVLCLLVCIYFKNSGYALLVLKTLISTYTFNIQLFKIIL